MEQFRSNCRAAHSRTKRSSRTSSRRHCAGSSKIGCAEFAQNQALSAMQNQQRNQSLAEQYQQRNQPINESPPVRVKLAGRFVNPEQQIRRPTLPG
jgi:hypothetical protein